MSQIHHALLYVCDCMSVIVCLCIGAHGVRQIAGSPRWELDQSSRSASEYFASTHPCQHAHQRAEHCDRHEHQQSSSEVPNGSPHVAREAVAFPVCHTTVQLHPPLLEHVVEQLALIQVGR